jgi:hypothetical protein
MSNKELEGQYARWSVMLSEFNFIIEYKPGFKHIVADVPSRFPRSTTADVTGTRESFQIFLPTQTMPLLDHGLASLSICLAFAPNDFHGYCLNHSYDLLNHPSDSFDAFDDNAFSSSPYVETENHMGNLNADDEHVTALHSALFTPSCERLISQFLSTSDIHSQSSSFDFHDMSSLSISFDHREEYTSVHDSQCILRLTAVQQVEHCHNVLSQLAATPSLPLHIGPSPFHDIVHSICTEPLPPSCIC